jgi:hypothetical protein
LGAASAVPAHRKTIKVKITPIFFSMGHSSLYDWLTICGNFFPYHFFRQFF